MSQAETEADKHLPVFKIVFVGDASVGKTSIIMRYHHGLFTDDRQATIGSAFVTRQVTTKYGDAKINIWDTAGQERYRSLVPMYSRGASICIVVFDVTEPESFEGLDDWIQRLHDELSEGCKIVVAANKIDLEANVDRSIIDAWSKRTNIDVIHLSAKTGENVDLLFSTVCDMLPAALFRMNSATLEKNNSNTGKKCCG